jgi:hypothetical protein
LVNDLKNALLQEFGTHSARDMMNEVEIMRVAQSSTSCERAFSPGNARE